MASPTACLRESGAARNCKIWFSFFARHVCWGDDALPARRLDDLEDSPERTMLVALCCRTGRDFGDLARLQTRRPPGDRLAASAVSTFGTRGDEDERDEIVPGVLAGE